MSKLFNRYFHLLAFAAMVSAIVFISDHKDIELPKAESKAVLHEDLKEFYKRAEAVAEKSGREFLMQVRQEGSGISINFQVGKVFYPGSDGFLSNYEQELLNIFKELKIDKLKAFVEVEGHTDTLQLRSNTWKHKNNFSLSAFRAAKFGNLLLNMGFPQEQLKISGRGPALALVAERGLASEKDRASKILDRRIVIHIRKAEL